mgnify:CR=1 FL=1
MLEKSFKYHEILLQNNRFKNLKTTEKRAFLLHRQVSYNQLVMK